MTESYDPFERGACAVTERTLALDDRERGRAFPCEVWSPAEAGTGTLPLVVYSHFSGGHRRAASFLCAHLASHGYLVAALDHSEVVAPELARRPDEGREQRSARIDAVIASRVPDVRFLLDSLLRRDALDGIATIDPAAVGIVGHSFGGWTALASVDVSPEVRAVVALAPGGASQVRPGILPLVLHFGWGRDVPALFLVAEDDVSMPLAGMVDVYDRTPATKRMIVLRRADHLHFVDDVETQHEAVRAMQFPAELAWMQCEMRPIAELTAGDAAHRFVRALTLAHFDATLRAREEAEAFLAGELGAALAARGVDAYVYEGLGTFPRSRLGSRGSAPTRYRRR